MMPKVPQPPQSPQPNPGQEAQQNTPAPPDPQRRTFITWLWRVPVIAAIVGLGAGIFEAYWVHFDKVKPKGPNYVPLEPQRAAALSALAGEWQSVNFQLKTLDQTIPATVFQVPEKVDGSVAVNGKHYLAFSRVCTHHGCTVNLNRNLETLAVAFNFRNKYPALACPCHLSVFAPLQAGKAVSGPARQPLPRVALEPRGNDLYAIGIEVRTL